MPKPRSGGNPRGRFRGQNGQQRGPPNDQNRSSGRHQPDMIADRPDNRNGRPGNNRFRKVNNVPNRNRPVTNNSHNNNDRSTNTRSANQSFKITIPQGNKQNPQEIIAKIQEGVGEKFPYYNYEVTTRNSSFFVIGQELSDSIMSMSRRLTLPNGFQIVIVVARQKIEDITITDEIKETVKQIIAKRFNPHTNVLSLSNFVTEEDLKNRGLFLPLSKRNVLEMVVEIIVENIPNVVAIDLSQNRIAFLDPLKTIVTSCPNVKALDLSNNNIPQRTEFKSLNQLGLVELKIENNPFCEKMRNKSETKSFFQDIFPCLKTLDDESLDECITFDVTDKEVAAKIKALPQEINFRAPPEAEEFVKNYVKQFFELFDSPKRSELSAGYSKTSIMTYSFSSLSKKTEGTWKMSHNLMRINDESHYNGFAHFGVDAIMNYFKDFPRFKHDIQTIDVPLLEGSIIQLVVCGTATAILSKDKPVLEFSRSFFISSEGENFIIQNDMYHISSLSPVATIVRRNKPRNEMSAEPVAPSNTPIFHTPPFETSMPSVSLALAPVPVPVLAPVTSQADIILQLQNTTNLTPEFSVQLLQESGYDLNKALELFQQALPSIPPHAFRK